MPPKTVRNSPGWKTGEQLEFLLSRWEDFKHAQATKALDRFRRQTYDEWYNRWPISSSPSLAQEYGSIEAGRLMLQKDKNAVSYNVFSCIVITLTWHT